MPFVPAARKVYKWICVYSCREIIINTLNSRRGNLPRERNVDLSKNNNRQFSAENFASLLVLYNQKEAGGLLHIFYLLSSLSSQRVERRPRLGVKLLKGKRWEKARHTGHKIQKVMIHH